MKRCATCDKPIVEARPTRRKFCSGKCRKAQYGTPCIECGAMTSGSEGRRSAICRACGQKRAGQGRSEACRPRREVIARMWHDGASIREIAAEIGVDDPDQLNKLLAVMRHDGWDLPRRRAGYTDDVAEKRRAFAHRPALERED